MCSSSTTIQKPPIFSRQVIRTPAFYYLFQSLLKIPILSRFQFRALKSKSTAMVVENSILRFSRLTSKAFTPVKGSKLAAGFDLKSAYDYVIPPRGKGLVKTDLQVQVPEGTYGRIAPRSGLAWKHHIDVGAGVIDADYTGNVGIVLFNHSDEEFKVSAGDRVAQLICEQILYPSLQEMKDLDETERGSNGFGSTGAR